MRTSRVEARQVVRLRRISYRPPVWKLTCSLCPTWSIDVGEEVHGLNLFQLHADKAGHEGEFAVVIDDAN